MRDIQLSEQYKKQHSGSPSWWVFWNWNNLVNANTKTVAVVLGGDGGGKCPVYCLLVLWPWESPISEAIFSHLQIGSWLSKPHCNQTESGEGSNALIAPIGASTLPALEGLVVLRVLFPHLSSFLFTCFLWQTPWLSGIPHSQPWTWELCIQLPAKPCMWFPQSTSYLKCLYVKHHLHPSLVYPSHLNLKNRKTISPILILTPQGHFLFPIFIPCEHRPLHKAPVQVSLNTPNDREHRHSQGGAGDGDRTVCK